MLTADPRIRFAETLFNLHPTFIPTQALYLDLEGRKNGMEDVLSLYWPVLPGKQRFSWIKRTESSEIKFPVLGAHLESTGAVAAKWIVVYSGGGENPDERERLVDLLDKNPFPNSEWINMLNVVQHCRELTQSIRDHRHVWYGRDQIRVRYSLEALEWEFGIERPISIRSHSNRYRDLDGEFGRMEVLSATKGSITGTATKDEERSLRDYCKADVRNMYEIAYASEQLLFSRSQRRERRQLNA
ncbi:MAG: hypothetical protein O2960_20680 [Verrucomicrobia bacterium]|nr:hypothetical protein [Verrucomicrobiota bacterium]